MKTEDLKKLKDECKLTTRQISALSGIPESTISRILSGQTDNPSFDTICALVKAMGGSLDRLVGMHIDSEAKDIAPIIKLYDKIIAEKSMNIKILLTLCCILIAVLIFIVILDVTNGSFGFVRY